MRYLLLSVMCCFISYSAIAQYDKNEDSDPKAVEILEHIKSEYFAAAAHKIDFQLEMEFPGQTTEIQEGQLVQAQDNFVLSMQGRQIFSDNSSVWMYMEEANEVQISDMDDSDGAIDFMSPSDIFNLYQSGEYVFAIANYAKEEGQDITQIECKPLSEDSDYSKMRLTVIDKGHQVKRLKIFAKDGSRFTMHIQAHDNKHLALPSDFIFNEADYPGVHVEDLRF